mgnify:CR=1 FL=1
MVNRGKSGTVSLPPFREGNRRLRDFLTPNEPSNTLNKLPNKNTPSIMRAYFLFILLTFLNGAPSQNTDQRRRAFRSYLKNLRFRYFQIAFITSYTPSMRSSHSTSNNMSSPTSWATNIKMAIRALRKVSETPFLSRFMRSSIVWRSGNFLVRGHPTSEGLYGS